MTHSNDSDVYIDPEVKPLLERMVATMAERGPMGSVPPDVMRQRFREDTAGWNLDLPELHAIHNFSIRCNACDVPLRLYHPFKAKAPVPCLVFIHGGGWVVGDLDTNERTLRTLALESGVSILSVDYPLAPEHKFPVGLDSCVEVVHWLREHGAQYGIDTARLAVGGDSAGGNLALATALDLRNSGDNFLQLALLQYPALSPNSNTPSHRQFGQGDYGLGTAAMEYFWDAYLPDEEARNDPRAAPLLAEMTGLPPVYLVSAGLDALSDDSNALARKLRDNDNPFIHRHYPGVIHGFFSMGLFLHTAQTALSEAAHALKDALYISVIDSSSSE